MDSIFFGNINVIFPMSFHLVDVIIDNSLICADGLNPDEFIGLFNFFLESFFHVISPVYGAVGAVQDGSFIFFPANVLN